MTICSSLSVLLSVSLSVYLYCVTQSLDVVGTLRSEGGEKEIREEYDADEFAAIKEKKRLRAAQVHSQSRDDLMAKARRAMIKCEEEERSSVGASIQNGKSNSTISQSTTKKSSLTQNSNPSLISEEDWKTRLERETVNDELNNIIVGDDEMREKIESEAYDMVYDEDDEAYDDEQLTDDDDGDDEQNDDDDDVPILPFGNLGIVRRKPERDGGEEEEEEDVPIVAFGNLGKTKPKSETTPPNVLRTISLTGSDTADEDTPRTRERKRLTWASGVEDNDAEKCDAFGSRLKAIFNTYKDEEIVVSDEEEEEEEDDKDNCTPAVPVETMKILIKHTPSDQIKKDVDEFADESSFSSKSPRHPGEIKADRQSSRIVSKASLTLVNSDSNAKTTCEEIGGNARKTCFSDSISSGTPNAATTLKGINSPQGDVISVLTTPPSSTPPPSAAEPKSILKKSKRNVSARFRIADDEEDNSSSCDDESTKRPGKGRISTKKTTMAVAEEITEREPVPLAMVERISISPRVGREDICEGPGSEGGSQADPPKRVSKFKQQRQNRS